MKVRSLLFLAGAALPVLAQELSSSNVSDGIPKRTNSRGGHRGHGETGQETNRAPPPSLQQRRLQLHLIESGREPAARSDVAYAALLMNDHDLGIRTLGQSLIDSRTSADLVAILGPAVTKATEVRMRAQGWRIRRIAVDGVDGDKVCNMDSASGSVSAFFSANHVILGELFSVCASGLMSEVTPACFGSLSRARYDWRCHNRPLLVVLQVYFVVHMNGLLCRTCAAVGRMARC